MANLGALLPRTSSLGKLWRANRACVCWRIRNSSTSTSTHQHTHTTITNQQADEHRGARVSACVCVCVREIVSFVARIRCGLCCARWCAAEYRFSGGVLGVFLEEVHRNVQHAAHAVRFVNWMRTAHIISDLSTSTRAARTRARSLSCLFAFRVVGVKNRVCASIIHYNIWSEA